MDYIKSLYIVFRAKMTIYSHCIFLTRRIDIFWSSDVDKLWSGLIRTFFAQKCIPKKLTKFSKVLYYIKSSCINFCVKMSEYFYYIHYLQKESTHFHQSFLANSGMEVLRYFQSKKSQKKNWQNSQECLNYIKSSCLIFSATMA